jgi:hypothetical protein
MVREEVIRYCAERGFLFVYVDGREMIFFDNQGRLRRKETENDQDD